MIFAEVGVALPALLVVMVLICITQAGRLRGLISWPGPNYTPVPGILIGILIAFLLVLFVFDS